jgi:hypothetical protein
MKDLLILTKIEELDAYSHIVMIQFPKKEQFVLCASIRNTLTEIIKLTVRAGKKYYKKTTLENLDIEIEYLRSLIRKAHRSTGQAANNFSGPALFPGPAADRGVAPADTKFFRLHETLQRASNSN